MEAGSEGLISEIISSVPGIDEAMSFAELLKYVQGDQYSTIVFDTAPTGHTLRLLSFPSILEKALNKLMSIKNRFSGLFSQMTGMMGASAAVPSEEQLLGKLETMKAMIEDVNRQFQDPKLTTFICVCIPEFLSLFETERLIQELAKFGIDVHNVVVNQVLFPEAGMNKWRRARFFRVCFSLVLFRGVQSIASHSHTRLFLSVLSALTQVPTAASAWRARACRKSTSIRSLTCTRTFTSCACRCSTRRCAACPRCASTARTCSCRSTPPRRPRVREARAENAMKIVV
jgi:anion-transporting  ArsA/GET3 family ATPase